MLTSKMYNKIYEIVNDYFENFETFNRYEIFLEARDELKEKIRYRDARNEIEDIILKLAEEKNLLLDIEFVRNSDGNVYKEYHISENDDEAEIEDDSDEYEYDENDDSEEFSNDSNEDTEDEDTEDEENTDCFVTKVCSRGRIYIPEKILKKFDLNSNKIKISKDYEHHRIYLSYNNPVKRKIDDEVDLYWYNMLTVGNVLNVSEGDEVKIYRNKFNETVIENAEFSILENS